LRRTLGLWRKRYHKGAAHPCASLSPADLSFHCITCNRVSRRSALLSGHPR
jgi:hypothetical protein